MVRCSMARGRSVRSSKSFQGLVLAFAIEPLGMLFALVAGSLWLVNSIYSIGYMRANAEPRQTSYYVCFAVALGATMGIAFAKNLVTLFLFYELLTLSTYPLVIHKANDGGYPGRPPLSRPAARLLDAAAAAGDLRHLAACRHDSTSRPAAFSPDNVERNAAGSPACALCFRHRQGGGDAAALLAARGDGRADAGQRAPARRRRRQGRRLLDPQGDRCRLRRRAPALRAAPRRGSSGSPASR